MRDQWNKKISLLVSLLILALAGCDDPSKNRHYRVEVDVVAEGELVTMAADFACIHKWHEGGGGGGLYRHTGAVTKRLPSGAGLIALPPGFCGSSYWRGHFDGKSLPDLQSQTSKHRSMLILWLDNAETPDLIEAYVSPEYYKGPNPRIEIREMRVEALKKAKQTDPRKEVPAIANQSRDGVFFGYTAFAYPKSYWEKYPEFAEWLSSLEEPTWLDLDTVFEKHPEQWWDLWIGGTFMRTGGIPNSVYKPEGTHTFPYQCRVVLTPQDTVRMSQEDCGHRGFVQFYRASKYFEKYWEPDLRGGDFSTGGEVESALIFGDEVSMPRPGIVFSENLYTPDTEYYVRFRNIKLSLWRYYKDRL